MYKGVEIAEKGSKVESIRSLTIPDNITDWKGSSSDYVHVRSFHNNQQHNSASEAKLTNRRENF